MKLGVGGLRTAVAGFAGTCAVAVAALTVGLVGAGTVASADAGAGWTVDVHPASADLFPGAAVTMPYDVRNASARPELLRATGAEVRSDGVGVYDDATHAFVDACPARWFRIEANNVVTDVEVSRGDAVHGALVLAFDGAGTGVRACQDLDVDVVVTAR